MIEQFFKIAKPDGWDFYTGKTINYRDNIGKIVRRKETGEIRLCSSTAIHASRNPNQCFIGGSIPCSLYQVEGKPSIEDKSKCGFKQLRIIKEMNPEKVFEWRYKEACNPVNPLKIKPPEITNKHIELLKQWVLVRNSVWDSVWDSVGHSVGHSGKDSAKDSLWDSVGNLVGNSVWDSVGNSVGDLVKHSVGDSTWDSIWDSVRNSIWDSVGYSVWDLVWAYIGHMFFPVVKKWKYIDYKPREYPFQPAVDLWKMGLIPSFDGDICRLHGGEKAEILWEGKL